MAGKETVKYIVSVFSIAFTGLWNKTFDIILAKSESNTLDKLYSWEDISLAVIVIICVLFYAFLLSVSAFDKQKVCKKRLSVTDT